MTTLLSNANINEVILPISPFSYRNVGTHVAETHAYDSKNPSSNEPQKSAVKHITQQEVDWLVQAARTEASAETRTQMQAQMDARLAAEAEKTRQSIEAFQTDQKTYFSKVELEVVQLSLAIATRILHRESQLDPMLIAGLVRVAIDKLHKGSTVSVRVPFGDGSKYRDLLKGLDATYEISVVEDAQMSENDCVLETELGSADFSVEAQLKEVERGFFDLLALRPQNS